jgi:hypothetical protein
LLQLGCDHRLQMRTNREQARLRQATVTFLETISHVIDLEVFSEHCACRLIGVMGWHRARDINRVTRAGGMLYE